MAVHETWLLQTIDSPDSNSGGDPDWLAQTRASGIDRDPDTPTLQSAFLAAASLRNERLVTPKSGLGRTALETFG